MIMITDNNLLLKSKKGKTDFIFQTMLIVTKLAATSQQDEM